LSIALRGEFVFPGANPARYIAASLSPRSILGWLLGLISMILVLPGWLALYASLRGPRSEKSAFTGLLISFIAVGLILPIFGFQAFVAPESTRLF
jgi:hypothetical protein